MHFLGYLFTILLVLLGLAFATLNTESVQLKLYFTQVTLPLSFIVILGFGAGSLLGLSLGLIRYLRLKGALHHQRQQTQQLEAELIRLRALSPKEALEEASCT